MKQKAFEAYWDSVVAQKEMPGEEAPWGVSFGGDEEAGEPAVRQSLFGGVMGRQGAYSSVMEPMQLYKEDVPQFRSLFTPQALALMEESQVYAVGALEPKREDRPGGVPDYLAAGVVLFEAKRIPGERERYLDIRWLYVAEACRRKGAGGVLLDAVKKATDTAGIAFVSATLGPSEGYRDIARFFAAQGGVFDEGSEARLRVSVDGLQDALDDIYLKYKACGEPLEKVSYGEVRKAMQRIAYASGWTDMEDLIARKENSFDPRVSTVFRRDGQIEGLLLVRRMASGMLVPEFFGTARGADAAFSGVASGKGEDVGLSGLARGKVADGSFSGVTRGKGADGAFSGATRGKSEETAILHGMVLRAADAAEEAYGTEADIELACIHPQTAKYLFSLFPDRAVQRVVRVRFRG